MSIQLQGPTVRVLDVWRTYETSVGIIKRRRREVEALKGVSFEVHPGEVFGLLGPNGAGKTTLMKILTTLLIPSRGRAEVLGFDVAHEERRIRPHINFVFGGERGLYWRLSGYDNLRYFADLYHIDRHVAQRRSEELLKMADLWDRREERVEGYSKGMKQRLHIAKALINEPKVLFLDEPTIGLDPVVARALRELIGEIRSRGVTVLLTSHYMLEMEVLCDTIAVLKNGTILTTDTPANLKQSVKGLQVVEVQLMSDLVALSEHLRQLPYVVSVSISAVGQAQMLRVQTDDAQATVGEISKIICDVDLSRLVVRPPNLEDAYVKLMEAAA